ncbi:MAG: lysophospholipid acyltransferase family protein [Phycisphaerales bacterium]
MSDCALLILVAAGAFWLLLAVIGWRAEGGGGAMPSPRPDISTALAAWLVRFYLRTIHRLTVDGKENLAAAVAILNGTSGHKAKGLIVTANHAAGIDPLMVQVSVPFFIRWMVAAETVAPTVLPFVEFADVIFLTGAKEDSGKGELTGVREAIRYVQGDPAHTETRGKPGVIGIFPEGRIARRPGVITPFQPGVGLIIAKSRGVVLPAVLSGVPIRDNTYRAFFVRSRAKVTFMPPIDYQALGVKAGAIAGELQARYAQWVGPVVPPQGRARK